MRQGGHRDQPEPEPEPASGGGGEELVFCTFHHLLTGKSHTKEQEVVAAAKSLGHVGLIVYGTPGVVVLHRAQGEDDEREFLNASRKIGKKVGETDLSSVLYRAMLCLALRCASLQFLT